MNSFCVPAVRFPAPVLSLGLLLRVPPRADPDRALAGHETEHEHPAGLRPQQRIRLGPTRRNRRVVSFPDTETQTKKEYSSLENIRPVFRFSCWPGFETKMIWYELAFVTFTSVVSCCYHTPLMLSTVYVEDAIFSLSLCLQGIVYIRVKTLQMVRMMRFGQDKFAVSVQRVARWQRKQHRWGEGERNRF